MMGLWSLNKTQKSVKDVMSFHIKLTITLKCHSVLCQIWCSKWKNIISFRELQNRFMKKLLLYVFLAPGQRNQDSSLVSLHNMCHSVSHPLFESSMDRNSVFSFLVSLSRSIVNILYYLFFFIYIHKFWGVSNLLVTGFLKISLNE
jgi:hypothetical protein